MIFGNSNNFRDNKLQVCGCKIQTISKLILKSLHLGEVDFHSCCFFFQKRHHLCGLKMIFPLEIRHHNIQYRDVAD